MVEPVPHAQQPSQQGLLRVTDPGPVYPVGGGEGLRGFEPMLQMKYPAACLDQIRVGEVACHGTETRDPRAAAR